MTHRHRHRRIGALLGMQPNVGEFRGFRIIGADNYRLGAPVAGLGHEMRVWGAGLWDIGTPHHQESGVIPVR